MYIVGTPENIVGRSFSKTASASSTSKRGSNTCSLPSLMPKSITQVRP